MCLIGEMLSREPCSVNMLSSNRFLGWKFVVNSWVL